MAYQNNIPQATDQLSKSQSDILNNFSALQTLIDVNLVDFADTANQGKHNLSEYVVQAADPTILSGELAIYNKLSSLSGVNELFVRRGTGTAFPITASSNGANGWTSLSSGLILQWGQGSVTGQGVLTFTTAFPSACYQVVVTIVNAIGITDTNQALRVVTYNASTVTVYVSPRTTTGSATGQVSYFAIGI